MNAPRRSPGRRRPGKSTFTTKSGNTIKLNQSLSDRFRANRDAKARKRAVYLSTLPQNRWKRLLYRLQPKRVFRYWFSREGAIMALKIAGVGLVACFILLVGVFAYFRKDLPNIKDISGANLGGSIVYYDRTGQVPLWQDYDAVKRIPVKTDQMSKYMRQATVAVEDKDFYHEGAFNVRGIARAGLHDITNNGGPVEGGSTITQQLVKLNQSWTQDRTITRKVKELILAVDLEREYTKDDILTGYLNVAPYGNVQYGVESAANDYFGISAKDLDLAQSAFLAAIPQSPGFYSPYNSPKYNPATSVDNFGAESVMHRQHYILNLMVKQHYISQAEADAAEKIDVLAQIKPFQNHYSDIKAPYFVLAAKNQIEKKYGAETVKRGGWKITTTLDLGLQSTAEDLVAKNLKNVQRYGGDQEAMVAEDVPTGQIVSLVGGTNFDDPAHGRVNYAQQPLPPGSSFKPYDYVSLINDTTNAGAGSVLYDAQTPLKGTSYACTNKADPRVDKRSIEDGGPNCLQDYDFSFPGPLTLRYALGGSRNVPAIKAMLTVGTNKVIDTAEQMMDGDAGYKCYGDTKQTQEIPCYASSGIGDGAYLHLDEHVNGLSTLSRLGSAIPTTYILKVTDSSNKDLYTWTQPKGKQVVKQDAAYIVDDMLSDPKASYLSGINKFHSYKGWKFAIKTGTTNDNYDGLMTSFSTKYAVVSWVGNQDRTKQMTNGSMETMTAPLTRGFMQAAHDRLTTKPENWVAPADIKTLPAFVVTHNPSTKTAGAVTPSSSTDIFPSWYQQKQQGNSSQTLDKVSGKVATACTPDAAKQVQSGGNASVFSADIFVGGGNAAAVTANDDVHNCNDAKPSVTVTPASNCSVGTACTITVTVTQGTHPISTTQFPGAVTLYVNNEKIQTTAVSDPTSTITFTYTPTTAGPATIKAEVIDSVLYSSSNEASANFSSAPAVTQSITSNGDTRRRPILIGGNN